MSHQEPDHRPERDRRPERNAMELTFKVVLAVATFPAAVGLQPLPRSLKDAPNSFGMLSAFVLCLGCVLSVVGILHRDRDRGLIIQQTGLTGVAFGGIFYAAALYIASPEWSQVAIAVGMSLGIGLGAIARFRQLKRRVERRAEAQTDRNGQRP